MGGEELRVGGKPASGVSVVTPRLQTSFLGEHTDSRSPDPLPQGGEASIF